MTTGNPTASITGYVSITNAPSIYKLEGPYYQIGGSLVDPVYYIAAAGDVMIMPDTELDTTYYGVTGNLGFGTFGAEGHIEWGETGTWSDTKFNIFDIADQIYDKIMGW